MGVGRIIRLGGKMAGMKQDNVTVVIRTAGERTTELCKRLVLEQVTKKNVFIVKEAPFTMAVKRTFEIGMENGLPWTMAVDADILLTRDAVKDVINLAERESDQVFCFTARVQDKFFRSPRPGGHLYRTSLLSKAVTLFDGKEHLRPETIIVEMMQKQAGYKKGEFEEYIVGLHDYEQYYKDIYRKAFVYAHKHSEKAILHFLSYWSSFVIIDPDYRVAFAGLFEGLANRETIEINIDKLPQGFSQNRLTNELVEKIDLLADIYPFQNTYEVQKFIDQSNRKGITAGITSFPKKGVALLSYYIKRFGEILYGWSKR
jgi:hypothetical protein